MAAVRFDLGPVIAVQELAADKVLAMFGRAAARDLVDLRALLGVFTAEQMAGFARLKDPGFDEARFNEALSIAAQRPDSDFAELGLTAEQIADVRDAASQFELSGS